METIELNIRTKLRTINAERAAHWRTSRRWTRDTRAAAGWMTRAARPPKFEWVRVEVWPTQPKGVMADVGAHMPTVKAIIDGIVDAGVLVDDGPGVVRSLLFHAPTKGVEGIRIRLTGRVKA